MYELGVSLAITCLVVRRGSCTVAATKHSAIAACYVIAIFRYIADHKRWHFKQNTLLSIGLDIKITLSNFDIQRVLRFCAHILLYKVLTAHRRCTIKWSGKIWAARNIEVLRAVEGEAR
ncbi:hypothetical protein PR048_021067 [Dryococelus australis]|uniref:Secreted protein n=1 Tax=Dryococelus australis TaxID=614101 RepID=A0ABQ9GX82_9NEOP|nr:hypothetical protein PR048_021067 [Dryococelus australis]